MGRALAVHANVTIATPAGRMRLIGRGGELGLELPAFRLSLRLVLRLIALRRAIRRLAAALEAGAMTLVVVRSNREIARLGFSVTPSPTSRLLGLGRSTLGLKTAARLFAGARS